MSEFLANLSTKDKVIFIGGGALVLFLLVKSLGGGSATDSGVLIDQSQAAAVASQELKADVQDTLAAAAAAQADQNAANVAALNNALVTQSDNLLALFDGYKTAQHQEVAALQDALDLNAEKSAATIFSLQTLIGQMAQTPVYVAPPVYVSPPNSLSSLNSVEKNMNIIRDTGGAINNNLNANVARMNSSDSKNWGSAGDEQTAKNRYYASGGADKEAARLLGL